MHIRLLYESSWLHIRMDFFCIGPAKLIAIITFFFLSCVRLGERVMLILTDFDLRLALFFRFGVILDVTFTPSVPVRPQATPP